MSDLRPLLSPDSIAVIGASADTETLRGRLTHALIGHGYAGRVYPVTRSQSEVLGLRAYASVGDLPEAADLAVIVVPAAVVPGTLDECGARGIRAAVVISSGFAEESGEAAHARDLELQRVAEKHGILVCGPNSEGIVNPLQRVVATFSPVFHDPKRSLLPATPHGRPIAVSCQSGRADLRLSEPRARPPIALHLPGQRRQPDRSSKPTTMSTGRSTMAAPTSSCFISRRSAVPTVSAPSPTRRPPPASH